MKAILLTRTGDPSVLEYVDVPTPKPAADQVLVKADTIGVSRPEILVRTGVYQWMPKMPAIPGIEMTGAVVEVGSAVKNVGIGQKVFITARELSERAGCYAEYIAVPARAIFPLPDSADLEAAACLSNYQVAYHVIYTSGRCIPNGIAVIDTAAGGTGSAAVQLCKIAGMTVIAIVGGQKKKEAVLAFGADHAIDYQSEDQIARVAEITHGEGADLVLDGVGGKSVTQKYAMVGNFGTIVSYGGMGGPLEENVIANLRGKYFERSAGIRFFTMHTMDHKPHLRAESMNYLIARLADGAIKPLIHGRLHLSEAYKAHELLETRQVIGKVLLKP